ncbi:MAG: Eco57I restriction-modification methylase domain-containing protein, partial [Bacteroidota bacterium]
ERFDLVIGNPPYGDFQSLEAGLGERKFTQAQSYEEYFTLRGVELLKPGGILVFILPSRFTEGGVTPAKELIAKSRVELLSGYWIPEKQFEGTAIDAVILAFKKPTR